ncbi:MAG: fumarylacetoacetate hydrolase, partial [Halobacteriaceae archaeon]
MRYFNADGSLLADDGANKYDLTSACPDLSTFRDLARSASIEETTIDHVARRHADERHTVNDILSDHLNLPLRPSEVWAAGVTYAISEEAREGESNMPEIYFDVYD